MDRRCPTRIRDTILETFSGSFALFDYGPNDSSGLVAISTQRFANSLFIHGGNRGGASQISLPLLAHPSRQVAGTGLPMLGLSGGGQSKPLLGPLMGLLLGHLS